MTAFSQVDVFGSIQDLIVHLHRGHDKMAESLVNDVAGHLKELLSGGDDPASIEMQRAQQTMFAIDETRSLLAQGDCDGAVISARDALKEWRQKPEAAVGG